MEKAPATDAVYSYAIPGRIKPKPIKIGIQSFPAWRSAIKTRTEYNSTLWGRQVGSLTRRPKGSSAAFWQR